MSYSHEICLRAVKGHQGAIQFLDLITDIAHTWDDLHDKDKAVSDGQVDQAFWNALVELPRNQFYQQNFVALNATVSLAIQNWCASNELEDTLSDDDKEISFITRSGYVDLVILCAVIIGGYDWGREITPALRRYCHSEGLAGYKANLTKEKEARNG